MKQRSAIAVIENRFIKINGSLDAVLANFAIEDIHRFRVEIKKLRAFLHVLKTGVKDPGAVKLSGKIKFFYRTIGIIRNLQLQQDRIKKMATETADELPSEYLRMLNEEAKLKIARAGNLMKNHKPFRKQKKHILSVLKGGHCKIKTKRFLSSESKLLQHQLLLSELQDKTLHLIRKILKDVLYAQPYINHKIKNTLPSSLSDQANVKLLADLLGNFQDACTGLAFLNFCPMDDLPEVERIFLKNVEKEWQDDKEGIRQKIIDQLKQSHFIPNPIKPGRKEICLN